MTHNGGVLKKVVLDTEADGARDVTQTHVAAVWSALVNSSWPVVAIRTHFTVDAHCVVLKVWLFRVKKRKTNQYKNQDTNMFISV